MVLYDERTLCLFCMSCLKTSKLKRFLKNKKNSSSQFEGNRRFPHHNWGIPTGSNHPCRRTCTSHSLQPKTHEALSFYTSFYTYVMGLRNFPPPRQTRLAVNSVTFGDYDRPIKISRFVKDIHAGFQTLNLKNDSLRRRSDSIKYNVSSPRSRSFPCAKIFVNHKINFFPD